MKYKKGRLACIIIFLILGCVLLALGLGAEFGAITDLNITANVLIIHSIIISFTLGGIIIILISLILSINEFFKCKNFKLNNKEEKNEEVVEPKGEVILENIIPIQGEVELNK